MTLRQRLLSSLVGVAIRRPWAVCAAALLMALVSLALVWVFELGIETSRVDLWPSEHPLQKRFDAYQEEFGSAIQLIVVVEGEQPLHNKRTADRIASRVRAEVPEITEILYKMDLTAVKDRALLFAPLEQLEKAREAIEGLAPAEGEEGARTSVRLRGLVGVLEQANEALAGIEEGETQALSALEGHLDPLLDAGDTVLDELAAWLRDEDRVELSIIEASGDELGAAQGFDPAGYLTADGGRMVVLLLQPGENNDRLSYLASFVNPVRAIVAEEAAREAAVTVGVTGMPVFALDELEVAHHDLRVVTLVSAVGVLLLFLLGYGSLWNTVFIALTLGLGVILDLGFTAVVIGKVNLISSLFIAVLLGLGIDYGIQVINRYQEERGQGRPAPEAMRQAVVHTGSGVLTGGVTTAAAFFTMAFGEFDPLCELGLMAGAGVLFILLASFVLLPALILLRGDRKGAEEGAPRGLLAGTWSLPVLPLRGRRKAYGVAAVGFVVTALLALPIRPISFSNDVMAMLPQNIESVEWLRKLENTGMFTSAFAASLADSLEEVEVRTRAFEALPTVSRVQSVATFLPADQEQKAPLVQAIRAAGRRLPHLAMATPPIAKDTLVEALRELKGFLDLDLPLTLRTHGHADAAEKLAPLSAKLGGLLDEIAATPPDVVAQKLGGLQARLAELIADAVHFIDSDALTVSAADLPPDAAKMFYRAPDGAGGPARFLIQVYPNGDVNDDAFMPQFLADIRTVDPIITGYPVNFYEFALVMQQDFKRAFLYAFLAIVLLLALDLRRPRDVLLAMLPLAMGSVWMVGAMNLIGIEYNLANIMAIPLIIGIGVAYGVYAIHRAREDRKPSPRKVVRTRGKAILFSALTTMVSFGAMSFASHRGAAGLGQTLLLGIGFCLITALGILPALLRITSSSHRSARHRGSRQGAKSPTS